LGRGRSEEAAPRRSRGGGRVRPSPASSGELGLAGLGLTASLEIEEVAMGFGRGNAVAEEVRRRGAGHHRRWRRRRNRGGGLLARGTSSGGLYRRGRERVRVYFAWEEMRCRWRSEPACRRAGGAGSWRGVMAAGERVWAACPRERGQGAGQVALESSLGSTWPRTRRGRSPLAAYVRAAVKQRGEGGARTRLQISKV
jgi:hypothetical protein